MSVIDCTTPPDTLQVAVGVLVEVPPENETEQLLYPLPPLIRLRLAT
ncbi:MAG: hypothetical protein M1541_03300 [Acidobacteria bacterium]|nr:hypothetical protein [Acidobacteriota bacterium]